MLFHSYLFFLCMNPAWIASYVTFWFRQCNLASPLHIASLSISRFSLSVLSILYFELLLKSTFIPMSFVVRELRVHVSEGSLLSDALVYLPLWPPFPVWEAVPEAVPDFV